MVLREGEEDRGIWIIDRERELVMESRMCNICCNLAAAVNSAENEPLLFLFTAWAAPGFSS